MQKKKNTACQNSNYVQNVTVYVQYVIKVHIS